MKQVLCTSLLVGLLATPVHARFIWITRDAPDRARLVFSDDFMPNENGSTGAIGELDVHVRNADGESVLQKTRNKNQYNVEFDTSVVNTLGGSVVYGVLSERPSAKEVYLRVDHAKAIIGGAPADMQKEASRPWDVLPFDMVIDPAKNGAYQGKLLFKGKPANGTVFYDLPGHKRAKLEVGADGLFPLPRPKGKGLFLLWAIHDEPGAGIHKDKAFNQTRNYDFVRHQLTLTIPATMVDAGDAK
jgi:hypothetical protein